MFKCEQCQIFIEDDFVSMDKHCPICKGEIIKACPNDHPCNHQNVPGIAVCDICGEFICPECGGHSVVPISRITGYLSPVTSWCKAKVAELKERIRSDL